MKVLTASLKHFIVQKLRISNQLALEYITTGRVRVNGKIGQLQQTLLSKDEVTFEEEVLKESKTYIYLVYYKPRGVESTLNPNIQNSLTATLPFEERVFPVGRLDKESQGLMLLTDDGKIYDKIIHAESHQEKEYVVRVNKSLTPEVLAQLAAGVTIMGKITRPARVQQIEATTFSIILTQGLNRQIRRMCYKLGYRVQQLIRVRMVNLELGQLKPGGWRYLNQQEIQELNRIVYVGEKAGTIR